MVDAAELLDWGQKLDLTRPRALRPSPGWSWLKPGRAVGRLIGGCLESMEHLRGTPYWPNFEGAIWFFETFKVAPSAAYVDAVWNDPGFQSWYEGARSETLRLPRYETAAK